MGDTPSQAVIRGLRALSSTRWQARAVEKEEISDYGTAIFGPHLTPPLMQNLTDTYVDLQSNFPLQYQYFRYNPETEWSAVTRFIRAVRAPSGSQSRSPILSLDYHATFEFEDDSFEAWSRFIVSSVDEHCDEPFDDFHSPHPPPPRF